MADYPFLPISVAAFMADTQHLDARETGAYAALIFSAWLSRDCGLPDDDKKLARLARCSLREWLRIKTTIMAFWQLMDDGLWHQKKLDEVRNEVTLKSQGARASARVRWLKNNNTSHADAERTQSDRNANQNHNNNYKDLTHGEISTDAPSAPAPEGARSGSSKLTSNEEWRQRLEAYKPWLGDYSWHAFWGPRPDAAGFQPLIPPELLRWWRAQAAQARQSAA